MKIVCSKSKLSTAISIVLKAVSTKTTMPILECILIEAQGDIIKLTANDMELGIETILEGEVIEPGRIALEAKLLSDIVRKLADNNVTIETNDKYELSGATLLETKTATKGNVNFGFSKFVREFSTLSNNFFCFTN